MDQCEDTQEGAPPSKITLCGEDESKSKAQRNQREPGYAPSCVSFSSDFSKDLPLNFKGSSSGKNKSQSKAQRSQPGPGYEPSYVSFSSDFSKDLPLNFEGSSSGEHKGHNEERNQPGYGYEPSCVSFSSDFSKDLPLNFKGSSSGEHKSHNEERNQREPGYEPSCVSFSSDFSKDLPLNFKGSSSGKHKSQSKAQRNQPGYGYEPSCVSFSSDFSKDLPLNFKGSSSGKHKSLSNAQSIHRERKRSGLQAAERPQSADVGLREIFIEHKISLKKRSEHVAEGFEEAGRETLLSRVYTELYITEELREEVHTQHEVMQLETTTKTNKLNFTAIKNPDIFKVFRDQHRSIRVVLTSGVAGAGKSFSVQKFSLDWAEGLENQDINAVVPLSFREMNLIRDEQHSLLTLIQLFHPTLQKIPGEQLSVCKLLFIFDGLDESRLSLDFNNSPVVSDVTQKSSVSVLLTNLIQGRLLPSALVWITSRPAAASQIPRSRVDRLTEVRGFNDVQKEEYFRRRFSDEELSNRVISHIKGSMSLYIMCEVPVFCWITAVVLENMLTTKKKRKLPTTLTDMYSHFLMVQTKRKKNKYQQDHETSPQELTETDGDVLLKLGRLAFEHLEKGNIMFYQEDLQQCGLDVTEASVYSGVCTEIFRRECEIFQKLVYSFVHLSVQEFLAAVYMFHCYSNRKVNVIEDFLKCDMKNPSLDEFLRMIIEKSLQSKTGHLDLFVRFLHGLSVKSNQRLLGGLLGQSEKNQAIFQKIINNLKEINSVEVSPDRSINIYHCLMEMKDLSVHQEIQEFLKSENKTVINLSEIHCSALAYTLKMSEELLEDLDLNQYNTSYEGKRRLVPAVRICKKFRTPERCRLSETDYEIVASALKSNPSHLIELDLTSNDMEDLSMVEVLCSGLERPNCRLQTLRLESCSLSEMSCKALGSALKSNPSSLTELNLGRNDLEDAGFLHFRGFLESPDCRLQILRLKDCSLSEISCKALGSALKSNPSNLTELDLSQNDLQDSGLLHLRGFLESPVCKLKILRLWRCGLSETSCEALGSALKSNPSNLTELELSHNNLEDSGFLHLRGFLESPVCRLQILKLWSCKLSEISCEVLGSALKSNPSNLTELDLSWNTGMQDSGFLHLEGFLKSPDCRLQILRLNNCGLSEISLEALVSALKHNPANLTELHFSHNKVHGSGFLHLWSFLANPGCRLQILRLEFSSLSNINCEALVSALKSNPSHLIELNLGFNNLQESDGQQLQDLLESPNFKLQDLSWKGTGWWS
uniref:NACHT, LRR and PYD domains-containing protein 12-like n=1 Tax=Oryzias melastigma TaxID=30732 RepID=A0A3B3DER9_ORYME